MTHRTSCSSLLTFLVMGSSVLVKAEPPRAGGEFRVNTYTAGDQRSPAAAMDPSGRFMAVWQSSLQDGSGEGIFGQLYEADGSTLGSEFQINAFTTGNQVSPAVASTGNGFVVVWASDGQAPRRSIWARRLESDGTPMGSPFRVDTNSDYAAQTPTAASVGNGSFLVVWRRDNTPNALRMRRYDVSGSPLGNEIGFPSGEVDARPAAVVSDSGTIATFYSWLQYGPGSGYQACGSLFNSSGTRFGGFCGTGYINDSWSAPVNVGLAMAGPDTVEGVWDLGFNPPPYVGYDDIFASRFLTSTGEPLDGREFVVNQFTTGVQSHPAIARDQTGRALIVWQSESQDGSGWGLYGTQLDAGMNRLDNEFRVNTQTSGDQDRPSIGGNAAGNMTVVWEDSTQDGSGAGIFAQRYCGPVTVTAPVHQDACAGSATSFEVSAGGMPPSTFQWMRNGLPMSDGGPISGTATSHLEIAATTGSDAASYHCVVTDPCTPMQTAISTPAGLAVFDPVGSASDLVVDWTSGGTALQLNWSSASNAQDYLVLSDALPSGSFATVEATSSSGTAGATLPMPGANRFYLVAGRNPGCGTGPAH